VLGSAGSVIPSSRSRSTAAARSPSRIREWSATSCRFPRRRSSCCRPAAWGSAARSS
jgi:hypothetical protein